MAGRSRNLKEILPLSELTVSDLKRNYKDTFIRYQMANDRLEFLYSTELKAELQLIKKELDKRKRILVEHQFHG